MQNPRVALSEHFDEGKEEGYANGLAQGLSQGVVQGRTEGMAQGMAQGKAEERLAIAKLLLTRGVDMNIITETTGLSEEEVRA